MRVLYVDDDRVNLLLFTELCRLAPGVEVELAGTAEEAMETAPSFAPDLLVLDLHLPDGDGFALLARLRDTLGRRVPAYLCSADDPTLLDVQARGAGFEACWAKPLDVPLVLAALQRQAAALSGTPQA